jgi:hypothetical protein
MIRARRIALATATTAIAILALTACSSGSAGTAATVGDTRISEQQLAGVVADIQTAKGLPVDQADPSVVQQTLNRLVIMQLINDLVAKQGLQITQGQIDAMMANFEQQAGSHDALEKSFTDQNIPPSMLNDVIRLQVQAQQLGIALDPSGTTDTQGKALFTAVQKLSKDEGVDVSPRYGAWDAEQFSIGVAPDDLAQPPAGLAGQ